MPRHSTVPYPSVAFDLLSKAIEQLVDPDATLDSQTPHAGTMATLNELVAFFPKVDPDALPDGSLDCIRDARLMLNARATESARQQLITLMRDWQSFWRLRNVGGTGFIAGSKRGSGVR